MSHGPKNPGPLLSMNPDCLVGILIMAYYSSPIYQKQPCFFIAQLNLPSLWTSWTLQWRGEVKEPVELLGGFWVLKTTTLEGSGFLGILILRQYDGIWDIWAYPQT